jgi:hypothetical protein
MRPGRPMTYRDEKEGLRARVADLETQLAEERAKVARLMGASVRPGASGDTVEHGRLLDAPSRVTLDRTLDLEIGDDGMEKIAAVLRPRLGVVSQVGRTLSARGFSLTSARGETRVRIDADLRSLAAGAVSCSVLAGGFLALVAFALAHDLIWRSLSEAHALWMIPTFILLVFPLMRASFRRSASSQTTQQHATMETVLELARQHALRKEPSPRVRVADPIGAAAAARAGEAAAEEEAESAAVPETARSREL